MVKVEPGTKGAMLTSTGEYMIPAIDAYDSYTLVQYTNFPTHVGERIY